MILIIEGMDNTGKTTLINQLRREYFTKPGTIVAHSSSPPRGLSNEESREWEVEHYRIQNNLFKTSGEDVILDRFHLGAMVYGELYRDTPPEYYKELDYLISHQYVCEVRMVLLTDSGSNIIARDDGLSFEQSAEEYDLTREKFIRAFNMSALPDEDKLHVDVSQGFEYTYPKVYNFLKEMTC